MQELKTIKSKKPIINFMKQQYRSNPYLDDCVKMVLSILSVLSKPSIMALTYIWTEKYYSEAYNDVKEAKI